VERRWGRRGGGEVEEEGLVWEGVGWWCGDVVMWWEGRDNTASFVEICHTVHT